MQSVIPISELLILLPDNNVRAITPERVRNVVVSLSPFFASRVPNANDDENDGNGIGGKFARGQFWFNFAFPALFLCTDGTPGAAVWEPIGGGGPPTSGVYAFVYDTTNDTYDPDPGNVSCNHPATGIYDFTFSAPAWSSEPPTSVMEGDYGLNAFRMVTWSASNVMRAEFQNTTSTGVDVPFIHVLIALP